MNRKLKQAIRHYYKSRSLEAMEPEWRDLLLANNMIVLGEDMQHDEVIAKLFQHYHAIDKQSVVASFLVGLENGQPEKRAALSAYAIMLNFPAHGFESRHDYHCDVCGGLRKTPGTFMTDSNLGRYSVGATYSATPDQLYVFLREHDKAAVPVVQSVSMLQQVLAVLRAADPEDRPVTMEKKLRAIDDIGMDQEQSRGLLDLLGHLGILETDKHKGFVHHFTYIGLAPRKSHSSDWSYPVDFWTGKDGVNEEAVQFWFGEYL